MEATQKLVKKSKGMVLEMPEYFTHEELQNEFGKNRNRLRNEEAAGLATDLSKVMQTENDTFDRFMKDPNKNGQHDWRNNQPLKGVMLVDSLDDINEEEASNSLLEDVFLSRGQNHTENRSRMDNYFSRDLINISRISIKTASLHNTTSLQHKSMDQKTLDVSSTSKYARLPNGMIINNDVSELKRQNDMLAKINAYVANNKEKNGEIHMPFGMIDSKSMAEFYSDLFSYAPTILKDAVHKGDEFERFKLTLKFAFSILHNLTF